MLHVINSLKTVREAEEEFSARELFPAMQETA